MYRSRSPRSAPLTRSTRLSRLESSNLSMRNAWLKIQLRKALLDDDRDIEIVRGCVVLE